MAPRAYLDTCIVSGLAKADLASADADALLRILEARKAGTVEVFASQVMWRELARIPDEYRIKHSIIYNLLSDVPLAQTHRTDTNFLLLGVGGGRREDPLLTRLKSVLRDEGDAHHAFQAARNSVHALITVDARSFLSRSREVEELCGVRVVSPVQFVREHAI